MPQFIGSKTSLAANQKGMLWMFLSTMAFSGMHAAISHVGQDMHAFQIAFFRNVFGILVLLPLLFRFGLAPLKANRPGILWLRAFVNLGAMLTFFWALTLAPLADVTALGFMAPIFATALAIPIFGERVGWRRTLAIATGFVGAMIVIRPGFATLEIGHLLVLIASFLWASAMLVIKTASKYDSSLTITLYMGIMMAPLSLPFALGVWVWPSPETWPWLVAIGALGGLAQWSLTEALKTGETAVVLPVDFVKLIWAALLGYIFFAQEPGVWTFVGGAVIFGSATFIALREAKLKKVPSKPTATIPPDQQ